MEKSHKVDGEVARAIDEKKAAGRMGRVEQELAGAVHDLKTKEAIEIVNKGFEAQIEYLGKERAIDTIKGA